MFVASLTLAVACDAASPDRDGGTVDAATTDAGATDAGAAPGDVPSASFLIDDEATPKDLWPGHPETECLLDLARTADATALEEAGLTPEAAAAIVAFRAEGLDTFDALDRIPHTGPATFAALLAAVAPSCACEGAECGVDPRPEQRAELVELIAYLRDHQGNAMDLAVDEAALTDRVDAILARGAGTPTAFASALRAVALSFPNGHAGVYEQTGQVPFSSESPWGVCARPHARGFVVTHVQADNPLGLTPGDLVVRVDAREGTALTDWLLAQPASSPIPASESGARHLASQLLFSTLRPGATLRVEGPSGASREVYVDRLPPLGGASCRDPFERPIAQDAYATLRPDGVAVVRLPDLVPAGEPPPADLAGFDRYMRVLVDRVAAALAGVLGGARAVVWDLRANGGGISPVGFAIVQGFLSTRTSDLSVCEARVPGTGDFGPGGGDYSIAPGGVVRFDGRSIDVGDVFDVAVPSAVITDGLAVSAADYFALATRRQTDALLVGAPTAGGYGSANLTRTVGTWDVYSDSLRCLDASGVPLERYGVEVDLPVDYDPADLAAGRDTVLEEAAAAALACGSSDCATR